MAGLSEAEKLNVIVTGVKDHYNEIVKNESASGGESIKPFCVDGAIVQCTMGSAPGKLTVIDHGVAITGKYAAHDEDRVPGTNIPSFGTCAAMGKPCAPSPVPKWLLTDEFNLMTNKRGAAATSVENCALITDSILVCMQGGIIKFVTSGQLMTVGDMFEMLKALFEAMQKGGGGTGNEGKKPAFTGDDGKRQKLESQEEIVKKLLDYDANSYFGRTYIKDMNSPLSQEESAVQKGFKILDHLLNQPIEPNDITTFSPIYFVNGTKYSDKLLCNQYYKNKANRDYNWNIDRENDENVRKQINNLPNIINALYNYNVDGQSLQEVGFHYLIDTNSPAPEIVSKMPVPLKSMSSQLVDMTCLWFDQNPQYKYLIDSPKYRTAFIDLINSEISELKQSNKYTDYEKSVISSMLEEIKFRNEQYTKSTSRVDQMLADLHTAFASNP